jgi:2'-5' RNA ligase
MKRVFIALKVEPEEFFLNIFSTLRSGMSGDSIKWTKIDNIHITLAFLGDTEENVITDLSGMLREICSEFTPFELKLKGTGVFRNFSDPRIIWTGVEKSEKLQLLYKKIQEGLKNLNIDMPDKTFNPHLTLGRIKHLDDKTLFRSQLEQFQDAELQRVPVNEVFLYESVLLPAGPIYTPISRVLFRASP